MPARAARAHLGGNIVIAISPKRCGPARFDERLADIHAGCLTGRHDPTKRVSVARFAGQNRAADKACKHVLGHRAACDFESIAITRLREFRRIDAEQTDLGSGDTQGVAIDNFSGPFDDLGGCE
jgi:hypothetical protein